jgi:ABC-2 type transport system permease protein
VSGPSFAIALRLRIVSACLSAVGMVAVILITGALFPAVGDSIGKLDLPEGVSDLLGGADYSTISGWMRSEIGAVYGPLVIAAAAITAAAGSLAGEEEDGILELVCGHPVERGRLVIAKLAAVCALVAIVALGTWVGLVAGVAVAGGGVAVGNLAAVAVHLALFGVLSGALALAIAAATGRKAIAIGGAAAFAVLGFLVNGFAPLVGGLDWLKYLSSFYYYAGHDPIADGVDLGDLAILGVASIALAIFAVIAFRRRDLRS